MGVVTFSRAGWPAGGSYPLSEQSCRQRMERILSSSSFPASLDQASFPPDAFTQARAHKHVQYGSSSLSESRALSGSAAPEEH